MHFKHFGVPCRPLSIAQKMLHHSATDALVAGHLMGCLGGALATRPVARHDGSFFAQASKGQQGGSAAAFSGYGHC